MGSGGGYRAVAGMCGAMEALKDAGLLDVLTYSSGLSGSSWYECIFVIVFFLILLKTIFLASKILQHILVTLFELNHLIKSPNILFLYFFNAMF